MERFYYWLTYGNFWIALGAVGLTFSNSVMIYNKVSYNALLVAFFATLGAYSFQRIQRAKEVSYSGKKDKWLIKNKSVLYGVFVGSMVLALFFLRDVSLVKLLMFIPFLCIVVLYRWAILGFTLRDIPGLKIILIGFSWGAVTVLLPNLFLGDVFNIEWSYVLTSSFYIFSITIPFDSRDYIVDDQSKKTIPQLIGLRKSCLLAVLVLLVIGFVFFFILDKPLMGFYCLISVFIVSFSYKIRPDWYYSFILDGLLVIMPLIFIF